MKDSEFFKRAAKDAAFRRSKLDDLRYFRRVGLGVTWFCAALGGALSLYFGFTAGEWDKGTMLLFMAFLCASTHHACSTRMAALQALDEPTTQ